MIISVAMCKIALKMNRKRHFVDLGRTHNWSLSGLMLQMVPDVVDRKVRGSSGNLGYMATQSNAGEGSA
jgi:hypothetical protein